MLLTVCRLGSSSLYLDFGTVKYVSLEVSRSYVENRAKWSGCLAVIQEWRMAIPV